MHFCKTKSTFFAIFQRWAKVLLFLKVAVFFFSNICQINQCLLTLHIQSYQQMSDIINIRKLLGADVLDRINCADIAERYFHRSRSWFTQRLNNNLVNGKPVSFTADELRTLRIALKGMAVDLTKFTSQIPNLPTVMSVKVYVINDPILIDFAMDGDIEGFKEYLDSDDTIYFEDPETFDTEAEALAFCAGIGHGLDERAPVEHYPLRSSEESDLPFIEAIENY